MTGTNIQQTLCGFTQQLTDRNHFCQDKFYQNLNKITIKEYKIYVYKLRIALLILF